ncbi:MULTISPECIES: hypothetical protein [Gammaproteobacteria]|jgi:hypothetical protein|uniref:Uncharacterized protein n=1 Tax=Xanthomonas boreopolis TaxID=86183 RepID=A0A919F9C6_9XANT|nr:hypothetical protein [Pseudomonas sp. Hp2]GHH56230.1 hypothetical protein GCM10009090_25800 [[Pseudomonas] boreopolis]
MEPESARQHAYSQAYALLQAATAGDPRLFNMAYQRAHELLLTTYPDEEPAIVEALATFSQVLGRACPSSRHPLPQANPSPQTVAPAT